MIRGFYTAGSGLVSQQAAIDNAANNISNANTVGYKKQDLGFAELLSSNLNANVGAQSVTVSIGNGSRASEAESLLTHGPIDSTGGKLDFAISSDGFFAVQGGDGSVKYTRDGSFHISSESSGNYLVTANGGYVLDASGNKISADDTELVKKIGIYNFPNPSGLRCDSDNLFEATAESGTAGAVSGNVKSGALEQSNVDIGKEMTDLIDIQRSYQFSAKIIQTADELEGITNNLR